MNTNLASFVFVLISAFTLQSAASGFIAGSYKCGPQSTLLTVENLPNGQTRISNVFAVSPEVSFGQDCKAPLDGDGNDYGVKYVCLPGKLTVTQPILGGDGAQGASTGVITQFGRNISVSVADLIGKKIINTSYTCVRN